MRAIGIVGNGADKFTPERAAKAKQTIRDILADAAQKIAVAILTGACPRVLPPDGLVVVSGHSPLGGVDIWAEDIAREYGLALDIKAPMLHSWGKVDAVPGSRDYGYKARDMDIARASDEVHVVVAKDYPPGYRGRRFPFCYHDGRTDHVKSGACWTAKQAAKMGKPTLLHIVD